MWRNLEIRHSSLYAPRFRHLALFQPGQTDHRATDYAGKLGSPQTHGHIGRARNIGLSSPFVQAAPLAPERSVVAGYRFVRGYEYFASAREAMMFGLPPRRSCRCSRHRFGGAPETIGLTLLLMLVSASAHRAFAMLAAECDWVTGVNWGTAWGWHFHLVRSFAAGLGILPERFS
jgi:hypothetical protein